MTAPASPINTNILVNTSDVWYSDRVYIFEQGGSLTLSANVDLVILGPVIGPRSQIFFLSDGATISGIADVLPEWWGAKGDKTHDDTNALQAAINCALSASNTPDPSNPMTLYHGATLCGRSRVILQPNTQYLCSSTITIAPSVTHSFAMVGAGSLDDGSRIYASSADASGPLLHILGNLGDYTDVLLDNFMLEDEGSGFSSGLMIENCGGSSVKYNIVSNFYTYNFPLGVLLRNSYNWMFTTFGLWLQQTATSAVQALQIDATVQASPEVSAVTTGQFEFFSGSFNVGSPGSFSPGSMCVSILNITTPYESSQNSTVRGIRFTDCIFYGGEYNVSIYSACDIGDIFFSSCQFNSDDKGQKIYINAAGGNVENIIVTGADFRANNAGAVLYTAVNTGVGTIQDLGIMNSRFANCFAALNISGVTGVTVVGNRFNNIGGFNNGTIEQGTSSWAIGLSNCQSVTISGNAGHNTGDFFLDSLAEIASGSDYYIATSNVYSGLVSSGHCVIDAGGGINKQVALNVPV